MNIPDRIKELTTEELTDYVSKIYYNNYSVINLKQEELTEVAFYIQELEIRSKYHNAKFSDREPKEVELAPSTKLYFKNKIEGLRAKFHDDSGSSASRGMGLKIKNNNKKED